MKKKKLSSSAKTIIGLFLGILSGIVFGEKVGAVGFIGDLYLKLIKMIVMPLILCTIISAVSTMQSAARLGRIGGKTILLFVLNATLAGVVGMTVARIFHFGSGINLANEISSIEAVAAPSLSEIINSMVTGNIFEALAKFETLPVIVFSAFFGVAILQVGAKAKNVKEMVDSVSDVLFGIIAIIMKITPVGVFCLVAPVIGSHGSEAFGTMGQWVIGGYVNNILIQAIYVLVGGFVAHIPLKHILHAAGKTWIQALTTRSSAATLPVNLNAADELHISRDISGFALPLGVTINMSGTCAGLAMYIVMASNAYGLHLSLTDMALGILLTVVAGIGMAGVPNQGIVFYTMIGNVFGFPLTLGGMIFGVDTLNDMIATASNTIGDLIVSAVVARSEHEIDDDYARAHGYVKNA